MLQSIFDKAVSPFVSCNGGGMCILAKLANAFRHQGSNIRQAFYITYLHALWEIVGWSPHQTWSLLVFNPLPKLADALSSRSWAQHAEAVPCLMM